MDIDVIMKLLSFSSTFQQCMKCFLYFLSNFPNRATFHRDAPAAMSGCPKAKRNLDILINQLGSCFMPLKWASSVATCTAPSTSSAPPQLPPPSPAAQRASEISRTFNTLPNLA